MSSLTPEQRDALAERVPCPKCGTTSTRCLVKTRAGVIAGLHRERLFKAIALNDTLEGI